MTAYTKHNIPKNISIEEICTNHQRKRIWEFYSPLKCPVAGLCLSIEEHKRILKKCGFSIKGLNHYELHQAVMNYLDDENRVSLKVDRFLNHKYRSDLSDVGKLNEEEFMKSWKDRMESGRINGIFWVAAGRHDLCEKSLAGIYGDMHMAGHTGVSKLMNAKQDLERQSKSHQKTARLLRQEKQQTHSLKGSISLIKTELRDTRMRLEQFKSLNKHKKPDASQKEKSPFENENRILRKKLNETERENIHLTDQNRNLEREKRSLEIDFFTIQSTNQRLASEIKDLLYQIGSIFECSTQCENHCTKFQLCTRRILIVGGMSKIKHLYRNLIESCGGEFEYHDGYMKAGINKLEAQVGRSDLVLCPVNCNSHGACKKVKSLCKKLNKPVKMLPQSSLSVISEALIESSTEWMIAGNNAIAQ